MWQIKTSRASIEYTLYDKKDTRNAIHIHNILELNTRTAVRYTRQITRCPTYQRYEYPKMPKLETTIKIEQTQQLGTATIMPPKQLGQPQNRLSTNKQRLRCSKSKTSL